MQEFAPVRGRKTKGLSFTVSCDKDDLPSKNSEHEIMVDLLNGCCDLADVERIVSEPTDHGEDFHGQFGGLGFFALEMGMIITEETEQIVYTVEYAMCVDEVCVENVHIALDADDTHIALDTGDMHIALDADDMRIVIGSDDMHIELDDGDMNIALDVDDVHITIDADDMHIALDTDDKHIELDTDDIHISLDVDDMHITLDADDVHITMGADDMHNALDDAVVVDEYNIPESYAKRLEAQDSKRERQVHRDSLAKVTKRWNKMLQKRHTVYMRKERLGFTAGVVMGEVDDDIMQIAMDDIGD
jgi:hypothetical protein